MAGFSFANVLSVMGFKMSTTGRIQFSTVDQVATGDREWSDLSNLGQPTYNTTCPILDTEKTHGLRFSGFAIPEISGQVVGVGVYLTLIDPLGSSGIVTTISLVKSGGDVVSRVNPVFVDLQEINENGETVVRYGGDSDAWGLSLSDLSGLKVIVEYANNSGAAGESFDVAPSISDCRVEVWSN